MRITLDIDAPVLGDLRKLQQFERKPLGRLVSDLLAQVLRGPNVGLKKPMFQWISKDMGARVDLADKEVLDTMDRGTPSGRK